MGCVSDKAGKTIAVILAGGSGSRMGSSVKKQFMELAGRPLIAHTLQVFQDYEGVDEIVLVASAAGSDDGVFLSEIDYIQKEIIDKYGFTKVKSIVPGGAERYHSVYAGLEACKAIAEETEPTNVLIHDGARAFVTKEVLDNVTEGLGKSKACVCAVPVKDTIKKADSSFVVTQTLSRKELFAMQTPQAFSFPLVMSAYEKLMTEDTMSKTDTATTKNNAAGLNYAVITDDAMVVEKYEPKQKILLVKGSYENIKVTTPDDLAYGEFLMRQKMQNKS